MKTLTNGIVLEKLCPECAGTKKSKWLESGKCETCSGIGAVPTEDGLMILEFFKKYGS